MHVHSLIHSSTASLNCFFKGISVFQMRSNGSYSKRDSNIVSLYSVVAAAAAMKHHHENPCLVVLNERVMYTHRSTHGRPSFWDVGNPKGKGKGDGMVW